MVEFVPRVKLLQESYRLMEMKKLLRAYGIRDTNLLKDKQMIMVSTKTLDFSKNHSEQHLVIFIFFFAIWLVFF